MYMIKCAAGRVDVATRGAGPRRGVLASSRSFQATRGKGGFVFGSDFFWVGAEGGRAQLPFRTEGVSVHGAHRTVRRGHTAQCAGRTLGVRVRGAHWVLGRACPLRLTKAGFLS